MSNWKGKSTLSFVYGVLFAVVLCAGAGLSLIALSRMPVAVADPALPMEERIVDVPLDARIERERLVPPFAPNQSVFEVGALIYREQCASCHGTPAKDVVFAKWMYPRAQQLWKKHEQSAVVGVSEDEAGDTFWKVKNGIRLTGMPAYGAILTEEQMWDVSLLLKAAGQPLPDSVKTDL